MGKEAETSNKCWFTSNGHKKYCKYSSLLFLLFPFIFFLFLRTCWGCVWNLVVTSLTHPLKFLSDRIRRLQQLNKKARDRALVWCPSPLSGTWPAQYNWERQMASDCFLFSFCKLILFFHMAAVLYSPRLSFCHVFFLLPVTVPFLLQFLSFIR